VPLVKLNIWLIHGMLLKNGPGGEVTDRLQGENNSPVPQAHVLMEQMDCSRGVQTSFRYRSLLDKEFATSRSEIRGFVDSTYAVTFSMWQP